jgi:hypothetical protein
MAQIDVVRVVVTVCAVTVKFALVAPAGTVTVAGTVATVVSPADSCTTAPPDGAAPLSVTVPVDVAPPAMVDGVNANDETAGMASAGGPIASARFCELAPYDAVTVTAVDAAAVLLATKANDAVVEPVKAVTLAGRLEKSDG